MTRQPLRLTITLGGALALLAPVASHAEPPASTMIRADLPTISGSAPWTYADLADLALQGELVARAQVRKAVRLKPEQAPGLPAGMARLYIEARTSALLVGQDLGESIRFLTDVPLDAVGKPPKLNKADVIVIAHPVAGRPGELLLVASDAMLAWSPATEQTLRSILTERNGPDAPPRITALREALHVSGNLTGEGETQLFFATEGGKPVSLSVVRRPGQPTSWGVSFSEIVDQSAQPPQKETLGWYRLACALPAQLPQRANISGSAADQRIAAEDYAQVLADLGPCERTRKQADPQQP